MLEVINLDLDQERKSVAEELDEDKIKPFFLIIN